MSGICFSPIFLLGLVIRLALIFIMLPNAAEQMYIPFLQNGVSNLMFDPWGEWISKGGNINSFPYGYAMWFTLAPLAQLCKLVGVPIYYGYATTILAIDFGVLMLLRKLISGRDNFLILVYWLSPIVIIPSYMLGLNDLIPVFFLVLAFYALRINNALFSGIALIAAISAKISMILALPFFLVFFYKNRALKEDLYSFIKGLAVGSIVLLLPFLFSADGMLMIFASPEMKKVYRVSVYLGENIRVYIAPLIYMIMLYLAWRIRRINYDLFNAILGAAFFAIVLVTPSSPGWFIWLMPFLVCYQAMSGSVAVTLTAVFSLLYILTVGITSPLNFINGQNFVFVQHFKIPLFFQGTMTSMLYTLLVASGLVLMIRMWRQSIIRNEYFRLSKKPFVIGISGDSGSGKDTFSNALVGLFGMHSTVTLSGDDYHLWDRQRPIWQVTTPLNPKANDLDRFAGDLVSLIDGKSIQVRHYDHSIGKMTLPFIKHSNDFIIASGLHALYMPLLLDCYDLSIYLDIEEDLRRYLKIYRDINERGHSFDQVISSIERREPDAKRFIRPQADRADLILSLQPIRPINIYDSVEKQSIRLKLSMRAQYGLNEVALMRVLIGVCGMHVDMTVNQDAALVTLIVEGDAMAGDISMAANILCPQAIDFLDANPKWEDGVLGVMQLITLSHISHALTKRFI